MKLKIDLPLQHKYKHLPIRELIARGMVSERLVRLFHGEGAPPKYRQFTGDLPEFMPQRRDPWYWGKTVVS